MLSVGIVLLTGCALFYVVLGVVSAYVFESLKAVFSEAFGRTYQPGSSEALLGALTIVVTISFPVLIMIWTVTLIVRFLQVAPNFSISPVRFRKGRENFGFSIAGLLESVRSVSTMLALTLIVLGVAGFVSLYFFEDLGNLLFLDFDVAQQTAFALFMRFVLLVGGSFFLVGVADMFISRFLLLRDLKMTREEALAEAREDELSPAIRAKLAESRTKLSREDLAVVVPNAAFVIAGTEHAAYAFTFDRDLGAAPVLVSSGEGLRGIRIKTVAEKHHVPIVGSSVLADRLGSLVLGRPVPEELYEDFARLIKNLG